MISSGSQKMKISTLSFRTEGIEVEEGDGNRRYLAFFYLVDGQSFSLDEHYPADAFDVIDEAAELEELVVLLHCNCGYWECSSLVANISEISDGLIEWTVGVFQRPDLRYEPRKYYFMKNEYEQTMAEIHRIAKDEILRIETSRKNNSD